MSDPGSFGYSVKLAGDLILNPLWTTDPAIGTKYTIISNATSSPTSGAFSGKPDGSVFQLGTVWLQITYNRASPDDTNDVILEVVGDPGSGGSGGSISGVAWEDTNADGIRDPGEPLLSGVAVTLHDEMGAIETVFTEPDGSYVFSGLGAGNYWVEFFPGAMGFTTQDKDQNQYDSVDSDVDQTGFTAQLILDPDEDLLNIDAGYLPP